MLAFFSSLLAGQERVAFRKLHHALQLFCEQNNGRCPSKATLYKLMARVVVHRYRFAELPDHVRQTLYNLDDDAVVPGHQVVFSCFNYGGLRAMSFAASLPWLALYQAVRMRGWRPKSRGPLLAACRTRGI